MCWDEFCYMLKTIFFKLCYMERSHILKLFYHRATLFIPVVWILFVLLGIQVDETATLVSF